MSVTTLSKFVLVLVLPFLVFNCGFAQSIQNKKLILAGHDAPDSERYLAGLEHYAKLPFDGYAIRLDCSDAGAKACSTLEPGRTAFSDPRNGVRPGLNVRSTGWLRQI